MASSILLDSKDLSLVIYRGRDPVLALYADGMSLVTDDLDLLRRAHGHAVEAGDWIRERLEKLTNRVLFPGDSSEINAG